MFGTTTAARTTTRILRVTEWSPMEGTVIEGDTTWLRVVVLDFCGGCKFEESHAVETQGEGAKCWNCFRPVDQALIDAYDAEHAPETVPVVERALMQKIVVGAFGEGTTAVQAFEYIFISGPATVEGVVQVEAAIRGLMGDDPRVARMVARVQVEDGYLFMRNVAIAE